MCNDIRGGLWVPHNNPTLQRRLPPKQISTDNIVAGARRLRYGNTCGLLQDRLLFLLHLSPAVTDAFAPSGNYVACGGLDNICSVYNCHSREIPDLLFCAEKTGIACSSIYIYIYFLHGRKTSSNHSGHSSYLYCCRFINDRRI